MVRDVKQLLIRTAHSPNIRHVLINREHKSFAFETSFPRPTPDRSTQFTPHHPTCRTALASKIYSSGVVPPHGRRRANLNTGMTAKPGIMLDFCKVEERFAQRLKGFHLLPPLLPLPSYHKKVCVLSTILSFPV